MFRGVWLHLSRICKRLSHFCTGLLFFCLASFALASDELSLSLQSIEHQVQQNQGMAKKRFIAWKKLVVAGQSKPLMQQLTMVNDFFNQFHYEDDLKYTGQADYWKTPDEFVKDGGGDCEDFAIAKYFTLLLLKVPIVTLRITYVKSNTLNRAHMVLAYYPKPQAEPLILDIFTPAILLASKRKDLIPVYSFNGANLWLAKQRGHDEFLGASSQLSKWQSMLERLNTEIIK